MAKEIPPKSVVVKASFPLPKAQLWEILTHHPHMIHWFFQEIPAFRPEINFEVKFPVQTPNATFIHLWKIIEVTHGQKIVYDWRYEGFEGESTVCFELAEMRNETQLTLTHSGIETFTADVPEFSREACQGGWEYFIQQRMKEYINGQI